MFGFGSIGGGELLFILVLALLLFGPRRIPEIGRTLGKTLTQLRRATHEFRTGIEREVEVEKLRDAGDAMRSIRSEVGSIARDAVGAIRRDVDPAAAPKPPAAAVPAAGSAPSTTSASAPTDGATSTPDDDGDGRQTRS